jgi:chorismate mutase/prephenate dehydratase
MDLEAIRREFDKLDAEIVRLLNRRMSLAAKIGELKRDAGSEVYIAEREDEVLRKISALNEGPLSPEALRAIYREIMSAVIALEKPFAVAYLGPEASNTHAAAMQKFGASVAYHALPTIGDIFAAVEKGEVDNGVIPIENSTEGSVREALDCFVDSDLKIIAQMRVEISHALLSSTHLEEIKRVYSKDQAIAQCRNWLRRNLPHAQLVDTTSTTEAVKTVLAEPGSAAIASELAARHYGVPIIARRIQDQADNTTRFFVLGRRPTGAVGGGRDVSSYLIALGDGASAQSGSLLKMLMPFSERKINLSKIESRPSRGRPWDYYFFVDVGGHADDPGLKAAVAELRTFCPVVKWLGSYPAGS